MDGISLGTIYGDVRLRLNQLATDAASVKETLGGVQEQMAGVTGAAAAAGAAEEEAAAHTGIFGSAMEGMGGIAGRAKGLLGGITGALGGIVGAFGSVMGGIAIFGMVKSAIQSTFDAAKNAQQADAQLAAVLKSTGGAAGWTAEQANTLAESLSKSTTFTREGVISAQNMLLTFTQISGKVMPDATTAVLNVAQAMGEDTKSAAIQLGKALNDPVTGMNALRRVGVTFDKQQQETIKHLVASGHLMDAQKIILKELGKEFGGSAEAAGTTFAGKLQILQNQLDVTKEKIGNALMPVLSQLLSASQPLLDMLGDLLPGAIKFISGIIGDFMGGLQQLGKILGGGDGTSILTHLRAIGQVITDGLGPVFSDLQQAVKPLIPIFKQVGDALGHANGNAQLWVGVARIVAMLNSVLGFLAKNVVPVLVKAFLAALPTIERAIGAVQGFMEQIGPKLGPALNNLLRLWNFIWPTIQSVLAGVWTAIQGIVEVAWSIVSGIINVGLDILGGNWGKAWTDLQTMLGGVWDGITKLLGGAWQIVVALFERPLGWIRDRWNDLWNWVGTSIHDTIMRVVMQFELWKLRAEFYVLSIEWKIREVIHRAFQWVEDRIADAVNTVVGWFSWLYDHNTYFKMLVDKIREVIAWVVKWLDNTWKGYVNLAKKVWSGLVKIAEDLWQQLHDKIVVPVQKAWKAVTDTVGGWGKWLKGKWDTIVSDVQTWWDKLTGKVSDGADKVKNTVNDHVVTPVTKFFTDLATDALTWGGNLLKMFGDGIAGQAGYIKDKATAALGGLAKILGFHSPAEEGPGSDADTWAPNLMRMMADGIAQTTPALTHAATSAAAQMRAALADGTAGYGDALSGLAPSGSLAGSSAPYGSGPVAGSPAITINVTVEVDADSDSDDGSGEDDTPETAGTVFGQSLGAALAPIIAQHI